MTKTSEKVQIKNLKMEIKKYKKGFNILVKHFHCLSDEDQPIVDNQLIKLKL
jgi:hypothetical protein